MYLWIDGNPVLYQNVSSGTINLTEGEHDITAAWYHKNGAGSCQLYWAGSVERAIVPSSQLVPVAPRALPDGWANARSFDADANSLFSGDVKVNADGSLDFAQSGRGLFNDISGYNFLWQPVEGDFTLTAKVESLPVADHWLWRRAGLMVRSSLDATAMMNAYGVYLEDGDLYVVESRQKTTATAPSIATQAKVAGATLESYSATPTWVRLIREGNKFTCLYRLSAAGEWLKIYEYEDENGEYGKTVYAGLAAWGDGYGTGTAIPYYLWRFSNVKLSPTRGVILVVR
jgi:regulation of enolase protein 1 (concanavalin A-like superfamily)